MNETKRKQDAHRKIQMGGLVVKAKLDYLHDKDKAILLGILVDAKAKLEGEDGDWFYSYYRRKGHEAFNGYTS